MQFVEEVVAKNPFQAYDIMIAKAREKHTRGLLNTSMGKEKGVFSTKAEALEFVDQEMKRLTYTRNVADYVVAGVDHYMLFDLVMEDVKKNGKYKEVFRVYRNSFQPSLVATRSTKKEAKAFALELSAKNLEETFVTKEYVLDADSPVISKAVERARKIKVDEDTSEMEKGENARMVPFYKYVFYGRSFT